MISFAREVFCVLHVLEAYQACVGFKEIDVFADQTLESHQIVTMEGMKWTKQLRGEAVSRDCTVDEARAFLEAYTREISYDPRKENCHSAQEHLRVWLGQSVSEERPLTKLTRNLASWVPTSIAKSTLPN
jgi:hypothetical protein